MYWAVACIALFAVVSVLGTYCWRGKRLGKDVVIAVLVRMPKGMKTHAGEYKNTHIIPSVLNSNKDSSIIYTGLVEMTYCGAEVWDSITLAYFPDKDTAEVGLAGITRAERAFNQSRGAAGAEGTDGRSRHDRLAAPEAMAVMQQMSYAPGVGLSVGAAEMDVGPKKRGIITTDSLLANMSESVSHGERRGNGGDVGESERESGGDEEGENESAEDLERGRNDRLETLLIPLQPQPPIAAFIYDWILHRLVGWFYKKAALVEEAQKKKRRDYGIEEDYEEEEMGHNPVIPPPQFAFLLPNARQRSQLRELARQNNGPMVMINLVQLLDDKSEIEYMQYAMKVAVFLLPHLDGRVLFQGPCMAGDWSSISCIEYGEGEAGVIKLEDDPFYHECHLHRENSLRHTVMLVTRGDGGENNTEHLV